MTDRYLVGLIGTNIMKSLSPALHEDAMAAVGAHGFYHLMDLGIMKRELGAVIGSLFTVGFSGVNVTHPYKEEVLKHLHVVSAQAREIGAVNTVVVGADGKTTGYNTDRIGFRRGFEEALGEGAAKGQSALLLGAGGAGKAVAWAMVDLGIRHLHIFDKDTGRAADLAADINRVSATDICHAAADPAAVAGKVAGIVNATPIGMMGYPGMAIDAALIAPSHWVADIVYTPLITELIDTARRKGCATVTGAGMCVHQAAEAFRLFTGIAPDAQRMTRLFNDLVVKRDAKLLAAG
ncbi:shikimate dehydrogenase [Ferrovibrio terrae]|uniref:shikimate dehydrogenase n=1 Tax=Ferrovibrio terrae TaxID=2594003 RepID=UPI00313782E5